MFTQVRLSNFKSSHEDTNINLRRISVFIGPNGSGKSSVLQALLLWRQSISQGALRLRSDGLDLGLPEDLVGSATDADTRIGFSVVKSLPLPGLTGNEGPVEIRNSTVVSVVPNRFETFEVSAGPLHFNFHLKSKEVETGRLPYF